MLTGPDMIIAPGAYDGVSARLIERHGYQAVYMTGAGTSLSVIGQPDLGLTTMNEMTTHAANLSARISIPLIADADTGYGGPLNVVRTVREYEKAGVAAIHLEDQTFPKRCGHITGKSVIPKEEFAQKIRAAVEYKTDPDLVIIARTDALAVNGFEDAVERANYYREAGADVIFIESPTTIDQIERIPKLVKAPLLINLPGGGRTPMVPISFLKELGYKLVIYPSLSLYAAINAIESRLSNLKVTEMDDYPDEQEMPMQVFRKMGIDWWLEIDRKYGE
jgi:2-methylisocitrate lyase-like PEP mutase family enzyme